MCQKLISLNKIYLYTTALTLFFFLVAHVYVCAQLLTCVQISDPMDCSPPSSSVHGIFQAAGTQTTAVMGKTRPCSQKMLSPAAEHNSTQQTTRHTKWSFKNRSLVACKLPPQKPNLREKNSTFLSFLMTNMISVSTVDCVENISI